MIKKIPLIFCFLALTVFAQNESHPIVEVDSAAYYEEMYNYNFQKYRFYLPSGIANGDTVLTLTSSEGTDISGSEVSVGVLGSERV
ncbi:MAG: hypothetical protein HUK20_00055, partial [Fibrobacter sp.]|nr:hypothetical protein [Fibrobacter sp.]